MLQDAEDDVAPMGSVIADRSSAARSAAEYSARRKREAEAAQAASLDANISISDLIEGTDINSTTQQYNEHWVGRRE